MMLGNKMLAIFPASAGSKVSQVVIINICVHHRGPTTGEAQLLDRRTTDHSLLWFLTMLRLDASTPREALLTASRGRIGLLYIHSPPSTTSVAPALRAVFSWPAF